MPITTKKPILSREVQRSFSRGFQLLEAIKCFQDYDLDGEESLNFHYNEEIDQCCEEFYRTFSRLLESELRRKLSKKNIKKKKTQS